MPCYLFKGKKQHSTKETNTSSPVTRVRWVVESFNGRIKQWRMLNKVIPNTLILGIADIVRTIYAHCKFSSNINSSKRGG